MNKFDNIISVICCIVPSGCVLWLKAEECKENYINKVIDAWKEQNPEYTSDKITGGFIEVRMPEEDYNSIATTNEITWPPKSGTTDS